MSSASAQPIGRPEDHNWSFAGSSKVNFFYQSQFWILWYQHSEKLTENLFVNFERPTWMWICSNNIDLFRMSTPSKCSGPHGKNLKILTVIWSRLRPREPTGLASLKLSHPGNGLPGRLDTTSEPTKIWPRWRFQNQFAKLSTETGRNHWFYCWFTC